MRSDPQRPRPRAASQKTSPPLKPARTSLSRLLIRSAIILLCLTGFVYIANAVLVPALNYEFSQQSEEW
jgi:hypothetical protein